MSLIALAAVTVGLHLGSHHSEHNGTFQNVNPGAYVRLDGGFTAGFYRNSLNRTSVYAGYSHEWGPVGVTAGAISGYQERDGVGHSRGALSPLLAFSLKGPEVFGVIPRLSYVPGHLVKSADVVHLSIEASFK